VARRATGVHVHATVGCAPVPAAHASDPVGWGGRRGKWSAGQGGRRDGYPVFWCVGSRAPARPSHVATAARTTGCGPSVDCVEDFAWRRPDARHSACPAARARSVGAEQARFGLAGAPPGPPVGDASSGRAADERRDRPAGQHVCATSGGELPTGGTKPACAGPGRRAARGSEHQRSFTEIVEELLRVFGSGVVEVTRTSLRT
jgi:hypothetical protein